MRNDLSVIVTLHKEGTLAHVALSSLFEARRHARLEGHTVQMVLVLDRADDATRAIAREHPLRDGSELLLEIDFGDSAMARNAGIGRCTGEHICTIDGDDLVSRHYFTSHLREAARHGREVILHPEMVVSFGMYNAFNWQVDQDGQYFDRNSLLMINPWISAVFAHRSVFERVPYVVCYPRTTGFGYEDWYWNCETIANGNVHRLAWGSVYFYRRKFSGSLNESSHGLRSVVPATSLWAPGGPWAALDGTQHGH